VPDLDNPANRQFAGAYQSTYHQAPNVYAVTAWDAAWLLDHAIAAAGPRPTSESINAAIGQLGAIDSPRGDWRFGSGHSPVQRWYLRKVDTGGRMPANLTQRILTTLGS
jgi:branched-chain amino acid transport system substrate-binding protein